MIDKAHEAIAEEDTVTDLVAVVSSSVVFEALGRSWLAWQRVTFSLQRYLPLLSPSIFS